MTKAEAEQFRDRWKLVEQARVAEVRQMSAVKKLQDMELLFEFGKTVGWPNAPGEEGWEYWRKLKVLSHV